MSTYDVVALGELLIDFTENGTSVQGNPLMEANPGGAPCNVLAMLQNLGKKTAFIGKVGDDAFGHMLGDLVTSLGVNTDCLSFDREIPTTLAMVHTAADGDRSFSFYRKPGADMMLTKEEVDSGLIRDSKIFHFGTLSMTSAGVREATEYAVSVAKESGVLISFDPNYRPALWDSEENAKDAMWWGIAKCNVLKISDDEILFLTGKSDIEEGISEIREKAEKMGNADLRLVCASMGKDGSKAFYKDMIVTGKPYPNKDTIETTGAGDTFMACMLHAVLEQSPDSFNENNLKEALEFANAAASIITTKKGALRVMPTLDEIKAFQKASSIES